MRFQYNIYFIMNFFLNNKIFRYNVFNNDKYNIIFFNITLKIQKFKLIFYNLRLYLIIKNIFKFIDVVEAI